MKANIVIFSLLVVLTFFFAINVAEASVIELTYDFATPVVEKELENYDVISMSLPKTSNAGLPVLPFKPVTVLIPYGEELEDIEVITGKKVLLGEGFIIEPGQAQIPSCFNGTITRTPPNTTVYSSLKEFPSGLYSSLPVQDMCGYKLLFLNLYPVRYIPKLGELWYYDNITVVVKTKTKKQPSGALNFYRGLPEDRTRTLELVDNPEQINTYDIQKVKSAGKGTSIVDPADSYDYVVITNEALKSSGGTYTFQDLVDRKNQKGVKATIVTREQIENERAYYWDGQYGDGYEEFNDTQAWIRNFIKDAYQNWGIKYVLLGGDYDGNESGDHIIPYRGFYGFVDSPPNFPEDDNIPSDLYYAAINGSWNSDLDDWWGEPGEADLLAEVFVGRAPVDSEQELTNFTMKTITYENTNAPYLKKALMVGEALKETLNIWGGDYKDEVMHGSSNNGYCTVGFPPYFDVETLYDRDWPENNWQNSEIKGKINNGLHIINNAEHGNTWIVLKMFYTEVYDLTNTDYFFGYAGQGCYVGAFDNYYFETEQYHLTDCILEHFVTSEHGAFAYVGSSRSTFYKLGTDSSSQRLDREFWDAVFGEGILHLGEANQDSKWDNIGSIGAYDGALRWDYYAFNLLGDPETSIRIPAHDTDVLIVDDDVSEKYEKYYMNALHANGYNWDCTSPPSAAVLLQYPVVVWLTGNDSTTTLTATDQVNLQTYLDSGGRLFISGKRIGQDIDSTSFYRDYLHADYYPYHYNYHTLNGVAGDPIGDGLTIGISGGDGANNQYLPDIIQPKLFDENASEVFQYTSTRYGAIKADTGVYKVVYFSFGFEGINNEADRNTVMSRVMRWLEPELITTCDALQDMNTNLAGNYYLGTDIDCSGTTGWNAGAGFVPVGSSSNAFTGTFDGRGHKITGLFIDRPSTDYIGLFGYTGSGSEIKDVGLEDVDVTGDEKVGGLVGQNRGTITDSYSTGSVTGGLNHAGGLVGRNYGGTIENCYSTADVSGWQIVGGLVGSNRKPDGGTMARILNSYSKGSVTGHTRVGGLAGQNYWDGEIINSYSHSCVSGDSYIGGLIGLVYGVTVTNSYSTGQVTGSYEVGGLIGDKNGGTVTHSYWGIETSGQTTSEGGEGKTTAEMKQEATFVGWDFTDIWAIIEDVSYPFLRWEIAQGLIWTRYSSRIDTETQYLGVGGMAIDSEDNIFIVSNRDIIKYDSNGALLWEYDMCGWGIAVDKTDDSIVVGPCNSSIIKFDKNGNIQWIKETNEPVNCVDSVSINSNGDILVAGMREDSWDLYWEIRDKNGNYLYSITRPHAGWYPAPTGTFGNAGNVFMARGSTVEKLTADLHSLWNITITNCDMEILSIGVDSGNNLFVHGETRIGGDGSNSYTGKYNGANGDLIWERIYDSGYMDGAGFSTSLTIDPAGNVFVVGSTDYETGSKDKAGILMIKYNGYDGAEQKHILYRKSTNDELLEVGRGVARDSNGYIYIGGAEYDISAGEGCGIETRRALTMKYYLG